ncbi:CAP domain-containing protein [Bacillus sp. 1P06AnD]|uniref:CAP domain-containing protein n=1 Tax=Bacillus sp. 1P06AnD TaxID=3132208 RepID=UPI0039A1C6BD
MKKKAIVSLAAATVLSLGLGSATSTYAASKTIDCQVNQYNQFKQLQNAAANKNTIKFVPLKNGFIVGGMFTIKNNCITVPPVTKPEQNQPEVEKPEQNQPEVEKPEQNQPEVEKPEQNQPEINNPEQNQPEQEQPEVNEPEQNKPEQDKPSDSYEVSAFEQKVVELTNVERQKQGLQPLTLDTELSKVARIKSQDMKDKNYFDHNSPTYGSPFDMMKQFGISYRSAAENIAQGQRSPEEVVNAWMNSSGHRANILNASYTHIGIGHVSDNNYWTQMFIGK